MRNYRKNISRTKLTLYIIVMVIALCGAFTARYAPQTEKDALKSDNLEITFIDVEQGDATLIVTPDGQSILVDGGEYDVYESHLKPALEGIGVKKVDFAVATHYHSDHMGGIYKLVKAGGAENLILPDYKDTDNTRSSLEKIAKNSGANVEYMSAGELIETGVEELTIQAIHPQRGGSQGSNFHNNSSIVLKITYGNTSILITGDIESRVEKELIKTEDVECDILKIAHHGSSSSSSKKFIQAADPTYGIISAGKNNSYGHPHSETIALMDDEDIRIYRTDKDGSITFEISSKKIENIKYNNYAKIK